MIAWLRGLVARMRPRFDPRVVRYDRRSRLAAARVAEKLDDDELRRISGLSRAVKPRYQHRGPR